MLTDHSVQLPQMKEEHHGKEAVHNSDICYLCWSLLKEQPSTKSTTNETIVQTCIDNLKGVKYELS